MTDFTIIIPCRYASTRLPGKPLLTIGDKTLIQHVYEAAKQSNANKIVIATDDQRIQQTARGFGAEVIMTSDKHESGTDRIHEAVEKLGNSVDEIVINLQGDEFGMSPMVINQGANALAKNPDANISTICEPIETAAQLSDPNVVKVVMDENNQALYFSRAPIPWDRDGDASGFHHRQYYRHIGLYAYRKCFLPVFNEMPRCHLEIVEGLEQLRAMYHGEKIQLAVALESTGMGIDTEADLEQARKISEPGK